MKKLILINLILFFFINTFAQGKKEKIIVDFYGIDFSNVNVVGADESMEDFIDVFERINNLLITESNKYDVGKYLNLNVFLINNEIAIKQIEKLKSIKFKDQKAVNFEIQNILSNYPISENKGLVIIAKELNKIEKFGIFTAVIFDGATKEVLSKHDFIGKAGGFGLRNYWAGAFYNGLKQYDYDNNIYEYNIYKY